MRHVALAILGCLLLSGCDHRPEVRNSLQQCLSDPNAVLPFSHVNDGYLRTCMRDKGYVIDGRLTIHTKNCSDIPWMPEHEECYRPDTLLAKWSADWK
jgi:hypothetical protein